jgi:hypothetical protein
MPNLPDLVANSVIFCGDGDLKFHLLLAAVKANHNLILTIDILTPLNASGEQVALDPELLGHSFVPGRLKPGGSVVARAWPSGGPSFSARLLQRRSEKN